MNVHDALYRALGVELRAVRELRGWSRPEACRRINPEHPMHPSALQLYEQGKRTCSLPRIVEVCAGYDVNVLNLLARVLARAGVGTGLEPAPDRDGIALSFEQVQTSVAQLGELLWPSCAIRLPEDS